MNPMGLSDPWYDSLDIIALKPVKKCLGINPMGLSVPWDDSLDIIATQKSKINLYGLTQWALVPLGKNLLMLLPCSHLKIG